jgi:hypothetical protein
MRLGWGDRDGVPLLERQETLDSPQVKSTIDDRQSLIDMPVGGKVCLSQRHLRLSKRATLFENSKCCVWSSRRTVHRDAVSLGIYQQSTESGA